MIYRGPGFFRGRIILLFLHNGDEHKDANISANFRKKFEMAPIGYSGLGPEGDSRKKPEVTKSPVRLPLRPPWTVLVSTEGGPGFLDVVWSSSSPPHQQVVSHSQSSCV
jgi:hypothetical protein